MSLAISSTRSTCARAATTVADAVGAADIVVVNVHDYSAADEILQSDAVARMMSGKLLVQLTSGSPRQARDTAAWAAKPIRLGPGSVVTPLALGPDLVPVVTDAAQAAAAPELAAPLRRPA